MEIDNNKIYYGILILIFGPLFVRFFTENFGMSYAIMPFFDVLFLGLIIVAFFINHKKFKINFLFFLIIISIICQMISLHLNGRSNIYGLSISLRNFYRLIFAILLGYLVLNEDKIKNIIRYTEWLLILNGIVMTYQYFVMGLSQDIIGGTLGNTQGVNEIQNVLCCYILTYEVLNFFNKKTSASRMIFFTLLTIYISALAELTIFFFELVIIFVFAYLFDDNNNIFSLKKIGFIIIGFIGLFLGIRLYLIVFPNRAFLLSFNNILNYLGNDVSAGNTGVYKISRIHPFMQLGNEFFYNSKLKWFGFGLGNCASNSDFYASFAPLLHYDWMSSSMIFLENGYLGVAFFILPIIYLFFKATFLKNKLNDQGNDTVWVDYVRIISCINLILFFYNNSLRVIYTSFFIGFMLSVIFIIERKVDVIKVEEK